MNRLNPSSLPLSMHFLPSLLLWTNHTVLLASGLYANSRPCGPPGSDESSIAATSNGERLRRGLPPARPRRLFGTLIDHDGKTSSESQHLRKGLNTTFSGRHRVRASRRVRLLAYHLWRRMPQLSWYGGHLLPYTRHPRARPRQHRRTQVQL